MKAVNAGTDETITLAGQAVAVHRANTVIVGAGAAGMGCAVQLVRMLRARGVEDPAEKLLVVTGGLPLGASRMSGSDKQTYYKTGTSPRVADTAEDFARALTAFGCCHGDNAIVEGICSLRGFYNLVEAGVPFPHEPYGAFIGYKTDHDPYERATSAGPKTSRFMALCLQAEAQRMGVRIVDRHPVAGFITKGRGRSRRIVAMVCIDRDRPAGEDLGAAAFVADNWVLAAGGPGELYQATVYPRGQAGIHGPAIQAGLEACNLTEWQYGLASIKFRWNVSGTYMQAVPRIFSTGADGGGGHQAGGDRREFLTEYFDDMPAMATNIFLKGYQWPFDAQRITAGQSSLIDMAVHQETVVRGRRVWMDFLHNPAGAAGWGAFDPGKLGREALDYLRKTGATQSLPIDRLRHMNQPAVDIYAENGIDLASEPLEIAVCAQHNNGGFSVDKWWQSNVRRTFVIGEMAGTHGVKRPGGSALNAGQVGAARAAEYIANVYTRESFDLAALDEAALAGVAEAVEGLKARVAKAAAAKAAPAEALAEIARRMTRQGAHLRDDRGSRAALAEALAQYAAIRDGGLKINSPAQLPDALAAEQLCLTQVAVLKSIRGMFDRGAGSRGSHCILADDGVEMHPRLIDPATARPYRFRRENESLRGMILTTRYDPAAADLFDLSEAPVRPIPAREIAFEPAWTEFRQGRIYDV
jgi:succinate dehydrogenase/fumarate reductase flavoprotein subunit